MLRQRRCPHALAGLTSLTEFDQYAGSPGKMAVKTDTESNVALTWAYLFYLCVLIFFTIFIVDKK